MDDRLTAKGLAPLKSGRELGPHVDEHVLVLLQLLPPFLHRLRDHGGYRLCVIGVEDITHPLLVQMMPVLLIGEEAQQGRLSTSMLKKVLNRKAVDLWHCGYFDCGPLDVLRHERPVDLLPWCHE